MLLKITVDPDPGYAVKEVFYTYNEKTNTLYAILPKHPDNKRIVLKNIDLTEGDSKVSFLSTKQGLSWSADEDNTIVELPDYNPNKIKAPYAFVLKIENYGRFSPKPVMKVNYEKGATKPVIRLSVNGVGSVRYTTDGSEPTSRSELYTKPFSIDQTSIIKAKTYQAGVIQSATLESKVKTYNWKNAVKTANLKPGIAYTYYQPEKNINMVSSFKTDLISSGVADIISVAKKQRADKFAFDFSGYIKIEKDGVYTFFTQSDDGSKLFIDDEEVVNNDGDHGTVEKSGKAALKKGYHKIRVIYFDSGGGNELKVFIQPEGGTKTEVPATVLYH